MWPLFPCGVSPTKTSLHVTFLSSRIEWTLHIVSFPLCKMRNYKISSGLGSEIPNFHFCQMSKQVTRLFQIQEEREWFLPPDGRCSTAIQGKMVDGHADTHDNSTHQNSEQGRSIAGVIQMEIKVQKKFY